MRLDRPLNALSALMAFAGLILGPAASPAGAASPEDQPNVLVVVTDDQPDSTMTRTTMPNVTRLISRPGSRFTNSVLPTPLCCPSRSALLSGEFGHNNGVLWNVPGYRDLKEKANTLPVWMRRAGYRTAHVGKYLNGYRYTLDDPAKAAPGWSEWHTVLDPTSYYSAPFSDNGRLHRSGSAPHDYTTSIINRTAVRMVRRFGARKRPLFMVVDQFAPHRSGGPSRVGRCAAPGPEPAVRDAGAFTDAPLPRPASFNEADVADKPAFIRDRQVYGPEQIAALERTYRCSLASLQSVDRGVAGIWRELGRIGERRNTALIFTSDNGLYFGEHRLSFEKIVPYRESLDVPLAIRLPGPATHAGPIDELVANVDLPATILDLAQADPCRTDADCRVLDGRSLVGLLEGDLGDWPTDRAIPLELDTGGHPADPDSSCDYLGMRTAGVIYLHHSSISDAAGTCSPADASELYDLGSDPGQLTNLLAPPVGAGASTLEMFSAARAARLSECAGIRGRDARTGKRPFCE